MTRQQQPPPPTPPTQLPTQNSAATSTTTFKPKHPAHQLLSRAHSPSTSSSLFHDRIRLKPLLLRPTSPPNRHPTQTTATTTNNLNNLNNETNTNQRTTRRHNRHAQKSSLQHKRQRQRPRPLSAREKRISGVHDLDLRALRAAGRGGGGERLYEVYVGLNRLWRRYVDEVIGLEKMSQGRSGNGNRDGNGNGNGVMVSAQVHGSLLASLDLHGAEIEVVRCAGCVGRVGTKGIVVRDTRFTFVVVGVGGVVRTIPKKDATFRIQIPLSDPPCPASSSSSTAAIDKTTEKEEPIEDRERDESAHAAAATTTNNADKGKNKEPQMQPLIFEFNGNQLLLRPADRANKKFKWNYRGLQGI